MRTLLYVSVGIGVFTLGGLIINRPFGDPIVIVVGAVMGLLTAAIRKPTRVRPRRLGVAFDLCDPCYAGTHTGGIPCPHPNVVSAQCLCARCSPHIGRYAPEDSPSYVRDYDGDETT